MSAPDGESAETVTGGAQEPSGAVGSTVGSPASNSSSSTAEKANASSQPGVAGTLLGGNALMDSLRRTVFSQLAADFASDVDDGADEQRERAYEIGIAALERYETQPHGDLRLNAARASAKVMTALAAHGLLVIPRDGVDA